MRAAVFPQELALFSLSHSLCGSISTRMMPSVVNRRTGEKHELLAQKTTKVYHAEGEWKRLPSPDHSQGPLSLAPASVSFTSRLFSYHGGEEISFTSKLGG